MDAPNSTPDQEAEGEQQPSALPIVCEKDNSQETSDHAPMVSGTAQLPMLLLTIAALYLATGSRNKTYLGDLSTYRAFSNATIPSSPFPRLDLSDSIDAYGSRACPNTSMARS